MACSYVRTYVDKIIYITSRRVLMMENCIMDYYKSFENFGWSRRHLGTVGARRVSQSKSHIEDPQILGAIVQNFRHGDPAPRICTILHYYLSGLCPSPPIKKKHHVSEIENSRTPLKRMVVIRIANYSDRLGPSGSFVEKSTNFWFLWPCIVSKVRREKTNKMQQLDVYY